MAFEGCKRKMFALLLSHTCPIIHAYSITYTHTPTHTYLYTYTYMPTSLLLYVLTAPFYKHIL